MKKFCYSLFIFFLTLNSSFSYTGDFLQKKENQANNALYNAYVKDYNKFKGEYHKEVYKYCTEQVVAGAGVNQFIDEADCLYDAAVDLLKKHSLFFKPMSSILYSWYKNVFAMNKSMAVGWHSCNSRNCRSTISNDWAKKYGKQFEILFERLDDGLQRKATSENSKYYANKKKEDEKGFNIDDNEIIAASSGSGFFVSNQGQMITNYHVIEGCSSVAVTFEGTEYTSSVVAVDKVNDLAIIESNIKNQVAYPVSKEGPQLLEDVIVAGFPLGKKVSASIKATSGSVTAMSGIGDNYSEFQVDAALNSGNSGGPIINEKGNVIGVAVSKIQEQGVESFNFGIKSSVLKTFASSNGLKFINPNTKPMKRKDLGALITKATVYLDCYMTGKQLKKILAQNVNSRKAFYTKFKK